MVPAPDGIKFNYISKSGYWAHCALSTPETSEQDDLGRKNLWCWGNDASGLISQNNSVYVYEMRVLSGAFPLILCPRSVCGYRYSYNYNSTYISVLPFDWAIQINDYSPGIKFMEGADFWYRYVNLADYPRYTKWPRIGKGITNVTQVKNGSVDVDIRNLTFVDIGRDENAYKMDSYLITVSSDEPNNIRVSRTDSTTGTPDSSIYEYRSPIKGIWTNPRYDTRFVKLHDQNAQKDKLVGIGNRQYKMNWDGNSSNYYSPINYDVSILSEKQIIDVSAIQRSVCALVRDETASDNSNKMKCWGSNTFGQIPGVDVMANATSSDISFGKVSFGWKFAGWQSQFAGEDPNYLVANDFYDLTELMSGVTDVGVDFPPP